MTRKTENFPNGMTTDRQGETINDTGSLYHHLNTYIKDISMYVYDHDTEMKKYLDSRLCILLRQSMAFRNGTFVIPSSTDTSTTYMDTNGGTSYVNNTTQINNVQTINIINYHTANSGNNGNEYETSGIPNNQNNNDTTTLIVEDNQNIERTLIIPGNHNSVDNASSSYVSGMPSVDLQKRDRSIRYGHEG